MSESPPLHPAAEAAQALFARLAPEAAAVAAPFVQRLFAAVENGDSFIFLRQSDADTLAGAAPIVGGDSRFPLVLQGRRLFLAKYWQMERDLAAQIRRLSAADIAAVQPESVSTALHAWFDGAGSSDQQAAAALALLKPFVLISGGPGTGKTTTVAKLLALLCTGTLPRIALAAPTGKAAARLSQALHGALAHIAMLPERTAAHLSSLNGQTVHRLLGIAPPQMQPEFHAGNPLPLDIVLIDEASMLDNHLLLQLLSALPEGCRVILLGDAQQLPSVGAGAVIEALTQPQPLQPETAAQLHALLPEQHDRHTLSEQHARLTHSHRFGSGSGIGQLARQIVQQQPEAWLTFAEFAGELHTESGGSRALVQQLYQQHRPLRQAVQAGDVAAAFAQIHQLAVLTALRSDAAQINSQYRQLLQQHGEIRADAAWFGGQIIMIIRNAPSQQLYNGDIGIIMQPAGSGSLCACFAEADGWRSVPLSRLPDYETAFAITVHKSQGSEYRQVWYLAPEHDAADNALLYTALTRAREQFAYWGSRESFQAACTTHRRRQSALAQFLQHSG